MSSFHLSELDSSFDSLGRPEQGKRTLDETMSLQMDTEEQFEFDFFKTTHEINGVRSDLKFLGGKAHRYAKNSGIADDLYQHQWPTPKPVRIPTRRNTASLCQSQVSCRGPTQTEFFRTTPLREVRTSSTASP